MRRPTKCQDEKPRRVSVFVSAKLYDKLVMAAVKRGTSMSKLIEETLSAHPPKKAA